MRINWKKELKYVGKHKENDISSIRLVGKLEGRSLHGNVVEALDFDGFGFIVCVKDDGTMEIDGIEYNVVENIK
jgi:hypothetical protein